VTFHERGGDWPDDVDVVFGYGPFSLQGSMLPVGRRLLAIPAGRRPALVWWLTENLPHGWIPRRLWKPLGRARVWLDRRLYHASPFSRSNATARPLWLRAHRLRVLGEMDWFHRTGLLGTVVSPSGARAAVLQEFGIPPLVVPLGYHAESYGYDMRLARDIDVAFIGQINGRRGRLLTKVAAALRSRDIHVSVHTDVYGSERTTLLNRTTILLNVLRAPQDCVGQRLLHGAANGALVVSEPMPDCPPYIPGRHYVAAQVGHLAATVEHYLRHDAERQRITDEAHRFVTKELTIERQIGRILDRVRGDRATRAGV
jgi:hypothetical protein